MDETEILTVPSLLRRSAEQYGDGELLISPNRRLTYRELELEAGVLARGLLAAGVGKGSRVGVMMPNSANWIITFMAAARIGAVVVPLSTLYQPPELQWVVRHADLQVLFIQDSYLHHDYIARVEAAFPSLSAATGPELRLSEAPLFRSVFVWGERIAPWARNALELFAPKPGFDDVLLRAAESHVTPADWLCIIYTSGSTADPKGVIHAHGRVMRHTGHMGREYWCFHQGDRFISTRPFFWVGGLMVSIFYSIAVGACLVDPGSEEPDEAMRAIQAHAVTGAFHSVAWVRRVAKHPLVQSGDYKVIRLASDSVGFAKRQADGRYRFPGAQLEQRFPAQTVDIPVDRIPSALGMTETICTHTSQRPEQPLPDGKQGSCGRAVRGVLWRIVDPISREPLGTGKAGELVVGGETLTEGYYKRERQSTFEPDGFLATGDLCISDDEGYLYIKGRIVETLKVRGANVSPLEVERCLNAIEGVQESAVLGISLPDRDNLLVAVVAALPGASLDEADVKSRLKGQLSSYKVPRWIEFVRAEDLPRTATGKIKKPELASLFRENARAPAYFRRVSQRSDEGG
jgi:acyl-CoA synthetase (AMP-forming)/AMP-acid ligase II